MCESSNEYKVIGKTDKSSILINERSLSVVRNKSKLAGAQKKYGVNPAGIVSIIPGVQVELGRTMSEFKDCLKEIRKPIGLQKLADTGGQAIWDIIRLPTGKVPEAVVCKITTINDMMVSVSFNKALIANKEYKRYQPLSVIHQLTAGRDGETALLSKAVSAVSTITGEGTDKFKIKASDKTIVVSTVLKELETQYKYTFTKDKNGIFNLLSISILPKKL